MALDGLLRAAIAGTTGYLSGRGLRQQREQAEAEAAEQREYERQRQAQQDALLAQLRQAQIEEQKALAEQRRREASAPAPVRNIDPLSAAGIAAARQIAEDRARAQARYARPEQPTAAQRAQDARDEAEGLTILASKSRNPVENQLFKIAWNTARQGGSTLSPGRLAKQIMEGLRASRPDLFRQAPAATKPLSPVDQIMQEAFGTPTTSTPPARGSAPAAPMQTTALSAHAPDPWPSTHPLYEDDDIAEPDDGPAEAMAVQLGAPPVPPAGTRVTPSPADRWEQLVHGGMAPAAATAQVKREFHLP
jgi:hypothetical protein